MAIDRWCSEFDECTSRKRTFTGHTLTYIHTCSDILKCDVLSCNIILPSLTQMRSV